MRTIFFNVKVQEAMCMCIDKKRYTGLCLR